MRNVITRIAEFAINKQFEHDFKRLERIEMTYRLMKRVIENGIRNGNLDIEGTMIKLDVFLIANRITADEYQELAEMVNTYTGGNA